MVRKILGLSAIALVVAGCGRAEPAAEARDDADSARSASPAAAAERGRIVFLGTSLTAGYGLPIDQAYPALIQQRIDAGGLPFEVVNAGVSGETAAGGLRRLDWLLREPIDVLVLELGANEGLRGQDPGALRQNLQRIVDRTRERNPDVVILVAGMEAPPNMGETYTRAFRDVFQDIASRNDAKLLPFLLEGVAAERRLNQTDGIHPTAEGQRIVAENVWRALEPMLRSFTEKRDAA